MVGFGAHAMTANELKEFYGGLVKVCCVRGNGKSYREYTAIVDGVTEQQLFLTTTKYMPVTRRIDDCGIKYKVYPFVNNEIGV